MTTATALKISPEDVAWLELALDKDEPNARPSLSHLWPQEYNGDRWLFATDSFRVHGVRIGDAEAGHCYGIKDGALLPGDEDMKELASIANLAPTDGPAAATITDTVLKLAADLTSDAYKPYDPGCCLDDGWMDTSDCYCYKRPQLYQLVEAAAPSIEFTSGDITVIPDRDTDKESVRVSATNDLNGIPRVTFNGSFLREMSGGETLTINGSDPLKAWTWDGGEHCGVIMPIRPRGK